MQRKNSNEKQAPAPYKLVAPYASDASQNPGESTERASRSILSAPYATDPSAEQHAAQAAASAPASYLPVPPYASEHSETTESRTKPLGDVLAPFATADPDSLPPEPNIEDVSQIFDDLTLKMPRDEMAAATHGHEHLAEAVSSPATTSRETRHTVTELPVSEIKRDEVQLIEKTIISQQAASSFELPAPSRCFSFPPFIGLCRLCQLVAFTVCDCHSCHWTAHLLFLNVEKMGKYLWLRYVNITMSPQHWKRYWSEAVRLNNSWYMPQMHATYLTYRMRWTLISYSVAKWIGKSFWVINAAQIFKVCHQCV